jgi:DNA-binding IclR family transcriptional regulator
LAHRSKAEIEEILSHPLVRYTDMTMIDPETLRRALKQIRRDGYATNNGEFAVDVGATAVIVPDARDRSFGALTVTAPIYRFDSNRQVEVVATLRAAAVKLSEDIRYSEKM